MFDDVSDRYDLLNRLMSLGQDRAWRAAMWRGVPEEARAVLDLCTGSGTSLGGLRRPGRLVLGADLSLRMLERAAERQESTGWAPRLVAADGFRLPLRDRALDAVTVAFGIRNLRPLPEALAEIRRVLRPGGTLVVLEAAAPAPGPFAPMHGFYLRIIVPLAGRLTRDPSAYAYLSRSIFEFGAGPEFERALAEAGFDVAARRSFLLGASRLWVARLGPVTGQDVAPGRAGSMQNARAGRTGGEILPSAGRGEAEFRIWTGVQLVLSVALTGSLAWGLRELVNYGTALPLAGWQRQLAWGLLVGGTIVFAVRSVLLWLRLTGPPPRP
jgi:demethylmenaquinone methyltransferase/2-methoxy-6-polyprenyl-1,4-benzoquinol methylase